MNDSERRFSLADRVRIIDPAEGWESDRATVVGKADGSLGWCPERLTRTKRTYQIRIDGHDYGTDTWNNYHTADEAALVPLNVDQRDDVNVETEEFWQVQVPRRTKSGGWIPATFYTASGGSVKRRFDSRVAAVEAVNRDGGERFHTAGLYRYVKVTRVTAERVEVDE